MHGTHFLIPAVVSVLLCKAVFKIWKLRRIPTVGYTIPPLYYVTAFRYRKNARIMVEEGQRRYPNQVWKIYTFDGWLIIANGIKFVEDISRAPEDQLSPGASFAEYLQLDYTLGPEVTSNPYHITTVRTSMTRNIGTQFEGTHRVVVSAFDEAFAPCLTETWNSGPIGTWLADVASHVFTYQAIGFPLCESRELRELFSNSGAELQKARVLLWFPAWLRLLASHYLLGVHEALYEVAKHIQPLIEERESRKNEKAADNDKKLAIYEDILTWTMESASKADVEITPLRMAKQIYFLSITSRLLSETLLNAVSELSIHPEFIQPIREEIEECLKDGSWTKEAFAKMARLDSFLREVLRCHDFELLHLGRKVLQDFVLTDGTVVPANSTLFVNSHSIHLDSDLYPSPQEFQGFRYVCGEYRGCTTATSSIQLALARPTVEYNALGYGKHACPGRFVAAYLLKTMLAHLILTFDICRAHGLGAESRPDRSREVFLRKRYSTGEPTHHLET